MRELLHAEWRRAAIEKQEVASIVRHFESLPDPRTGNAKQHIFLEVLIIAICAVICGADRWSDVELFGKTSRLG